MRIAVEKILAREAVVMGIAHGIDLVSVRGHQGLRASLRAYRLPPA